MLDISKTQWLGDGNVSKDIEQILLEVYSALEEQGYNPISQMAGYILSGDPTYITKHKGARNSIFNVDRNELIVWLLTNFYGNKICK